MELGNNAKIKQEYLFEAYDRDGDLKWVEKIKNTVVDEGCNDILDKYYKGSLYTAAHYIGLTDGTPTFAAGDTMASHAGWTEKTDYSESTRPTITWGSVASKSVDNSASKASFFINGTVTIGGGFVVTDNAKGGSSGTLVGGAAFSADRNLFNGDTLNVTVTATQASA